MSVHLIGRLNAEEACAVVAKAIQVKNKELEGYDYIVIVREKEGGRASMLSSLAENETIKTTLRKLLDYIMGGGRNTIRTH